MRLKFASSSTPLALALLAFHFVTSIAAAQKEPYNPKIVPSDFSVAVNNPFFTLTPGTTYTYKSSGHGGTEITKVVITDKTREVMGVTTRVVWDRVWFNDRLIEETYDWFAQDKEGNVWYFGEDSTEYKNGKKPSKKGSWEAGLNGAQPGIIMPAVPQPGQPYRQEYLKGEAEDMAQISSVDESVTVLLGVFKDCLKTKEWSALEREDVEYKYYSKEVGNVVLETERGGRKQVELIEVSRSDNSSR